MYKFDRKKLKIGDLVTHVLYGNKWIGVIVGFKEELDNKDSRRKKKACVQIQPGTEYENFFKRVKKEDFINDNLGFVSVHWLFRIEIKDEDTGSTRDKT